MKSSGVLKYRGHATEPFVPFEMVHMLFVHPLRGFFQIGVGMKRAPRGPRTSTMDDRDLAVTLRRLESVKAKVKAFKKRAVSRRNINDLALKLRIPLSTCRDWVRNRCSAPAWISMVQRCKVVRAAVVEKKGRVSRAAQEVAVPYRTARRDARPTVVKIKEAKKAKKRTRFVSSDETESIAKQSQRSASQNIRNRNIWC